ncbi:MAG: sigma 54-interacting transcriptional regulator [Syntrophomonadaceae bacterium]|nr:sigma 54-interacting transcriptional regulator [Syntrophomonadaceae bacterium]
MPFAEEIRAQWKELHRNPAARNMLRPELRDSWERSYDAGVNPYLRENPFICTADELKQYREDSRILIDASRPIMSHLLDYVAGSGFVITLCDPNCCILEVTGDADAVAWAKGAHLVPGSMWVEELVGTNAAAMSMAQVTPTSVFAYEHFCLFSSVSACFAAPILDQGQLLGGIGVIAPASKTGLHSLGMAVAASTHIQSQLQVKRSEDLLKVVVDSMTEGLFTLDRAGVVTFMNENCARIFQMERSAFLGRPLFDVLGYSRENQRFNNRITRGKTITDENFTLTVNNSSINCSVTCTPLKQQEYDVDGGIVVVIRESHRINRLVRKYIGGGATVTFNDIIHKNPTFSGTLQTARAASSSTSNVLLLGESGTGKDLFAQAMHNASSRRNHPYLAINCAALPRELIASELFGYDDGAFTGARKGGNAGKFELADQGTIFLDEIGDLPIDLQATLLRVLEEKTVMRLGSSRLLPVDVRIIAATNKDLEQEIERNRFRRDLYYRLGVIKISIPPLRERPEDIVELAQIFTERFTRRLNKPGMTLSPEVLDAFVAYEWPGNVRELQNIIEGVVQLSPSEYITIDVIDSVSPGILRAQGLGLKAQEAGAEKQPPEEPGRQRESHVPPAGAGEPDERRRILDALSANRYRKTDTAAALGISRATLYRKMKDLGIDG